MPTPFTESAFEPEYDIANEDTVLATWIDREDSELISLECAGDVAYWLEADGES